MTHILAAFIAIPYGLSVLMRGSDGLNKGRYTSGEAGWLAGTGGALILTALAMLIGFRYAGFLVIGALLSATVLALREKKRKRGWLYAGDLLPSGVLTGFLTLLIIAGI